MRQLKFALCVLLAFCTTLSLSCCGSSDSSKKESNGNSAETEQVRTSEPEKTEEPLDLETIEGQAKNAVRTLGVWDGSIAGSYDGGDGSEHNPFQIANGAQLAKLKDDSREEGVFEDVFFILTSDIILNDIDDWDFSHIQNNSNPELYTSWNIWDGIGRYAYFEGNFDGDGHTIYGLYNNQDKESMQGSCGLFGNIQNATIKNTNIACCVMNPCAAYVGVIAGHARYNTTVSNCNVQQAIVSSNLYTSDGTNYFNHGGDDFEYVRISAMESGGTESLRIGGICGYLGTGCSVANCSMDGCVNYVRESNGNRNLAIGGIVGDSEGKGILGCLNSANIEINSNVCSTYISRGFPATMYVGGICGSSLNTIDDCNNSGDINVKSRDIQEYKSAFTIPQVRVGGIAGSFGTAILSSSNNGQIIYEGDIDANVSTYTGTLDTTGYFDYALCVGGNHAIVAKQQESVTNVIEYIGVLDANYNWVVPLSDKTYLNPYKGEITGRWTGYGDYENRCKTVGDKLTYVGDDMFVYGEDSGSSSVAIVGGDQEPNQIHEGVWLGINPSDEWPDENGTPKIFHVLENRWVDIDTEWCSYDPIRFTDGYYVAANNDSWSEWGDGEYIVIINCDTGAKETSVYCKNCSFIGRYSEGLFFSYDGFYNIDCEKIIDLSEYAGIIVNRPYFVNGKCRLVAENQNGTMYVGEIDAAGNFVSEFTPVS